RHVQSGDFLRVPRAVCLRRAWWSRFRHIGRLFWVTLLRANVTFDMTMPKQKYSVAIQAARTYQLHMVEELITGRVDLWLGVGKQSTNSGIEVTIRLKSKGNCVLHWGLARRRPGPWQAPPEWVWPRGTRSFIKEAVQTVFSGQDEEREIVIRLEEKLQTPFLAFDLYWPDARQWENNNRKDYYISLPELKGNVPDLASVLDSEIQGSEILERKVLPLDSGDELAIAVTRSSDHFQMLLLTDAASPLVLH